MEKKRGSGPNTIMEKGRSKRDGQTLQIRPTAEVEPRQTSKAQPRADPSRHNTNQGTSFSVAGNISNKKMEGGKLAETKGFLRSGVDN